MVYVQDARELEKAMNAEYDSCDAAIMAAAVSDYRPTVEADQKIKKEDFDSCTSTLHRIRISSMDSARRRGDSSS